MVKARPRFIIALAIVASLGGCKLIDQTTFAPDPEPTAAIAATPAAAPRPASRAPLVAIRYDTANPDFRDLLAYAIRAAEQRRPGGDYDVVATATAKDAGQASRDAATIMTAMKELGVAEARIHLGARLDPALTTREVRIYLR